MKKIYFAIIALLSVGSVLAQSQRTVLVEEFTNASCPPCAAQNPAFNTLLQANTSKVISIKYQTNWPGVDPMNAQTQSWVAPRVTYYKVSGVPETFVDGNPVKNDCGYYVGAPACLNQTEIDAAYASTSPFDLSVAHTYNATYDSVNIAITITCTQAVSGDLVLHTALIEKEIPFSSAPGTNGETEFFGVMRTMFPTSAGSALPASWIVGDAQTINYTVKIPAYVYTKSNLAVLAFVQDNGTYTNAGSTTSGTNAITLNPANPNVVIGSYITGTGIPAGATVTGVSGSSILISANATSTSLSTTFTFANKKVHQSGISEPILIPVDASIQNTSVSNQFACTTNFTPSFELRNNSPTATTFTSVDLTYKINTGLDVPYTWTGSLAAGASTTITLPSQTTVSGLNTFSARITGVNGSSEFETGNNAYNSTVTVNLNAPVNVPVAQEFTAAVYPPIGWANLEAGTSLYTWKRSTTNGHTTVGSISIRFYLSPPGDIDQLISPKIDLTNAVSPMLNFAIAKARYTGYNDNLSVLASSDCGVTWTSVYSKSDPALTTAGVLSSEYLTATAVQWRVESASLDQFVGQPEVLLNFKALSGNGNNLYLDDINITAAVGLNEQSQKQELNLYPVPTKGNVFINLESIKSSTVSLTITDVNGKVVRQLIEVKKDNVMEVDLSKEASGTYFINVEGDGQKFVKKVVLEN